MENTNVVNLRVIKNDRMTDEESHEKAADYLAKCKEELVTSDYIWLLCSISDINYYHAAKKKLQSMVDTYYAMDE